ncbi:MAG: DUF3626 domain-containing protein [Oligoflexia bacterium]|nr:DUF3626 domain-containing protein [Oligoflexia bacterium]
MKNVYLYFFIFFIFNGSVYSSEISSNVNLPTKERISSIQDNVLSSIKQNASNENIVKVSKKKLIDFFTGQCKKQNGSELLQKLVNHLNKSEIIIHFDPGKKISKKDNPNLLLIDAFLQDKYYKNVHEVNQTSSGAKDENINKYINTRDGWEQSKLGYPSKTKGTYTYDNNAVRSGGTERPKYGVLNLYNSENGVAPQYGKSFFVLKKNSVQKFCSISHMDTSAGQVTKENIGTFEYPLNTLLRFFIPEDYDEEEKRISKCKKMESAGILKDENLDWYNSFIKSTSNSCERLERLINIINENNKDEKLASYNSGKQSKTYFEVQIHKDLNFAEDIEKIVIFEKVFKNSEIKKKLIEFAKTYNNIPIEVYSEKNKKRNPLKYD